MSFIGVITGFLTTPLKNAGLFGWKNYCMTADAVGEVVQARVSSDRFFTVDIAVARMRVSNVNLALEEQKYVRLEVYLGWIPVPKNLRDLPHPRVRVRGRLVWDGDGHLEIHPVDPRGYHIFPSDTGSLPNVLRRE